MMEMMEVRTPFSEGTKNRMIILPGRVGSEKLLRGPFSIQLLFPTNELGSHLFLSLSTQEHKGTVPQTYQYRDQRCATIQSCLSLHVPLEH